MFVHRHDKSIDCNLKVFGKRWYDYADFFLDKSYCLTSGAGDRSSSLIEEGAAQLGYIVSMKVRGKSISQTSQFFFPESF